ncbi:MAG: hypothetical protein LH660_09335 [Phormidesmis sp. CAN_BIN36]|nr:hypothetical protein [Phormidesmis sp. CAN_BIN36]
MADPITDINLATQALSKAVKAVSNTDNTGANDLWLSSLEKKANTNGNEEAKAKVSTLKLCDRILKSSISPFLTNEEQLGRVVSGIRGYQVLTEQFFSELGDLTVKDQELEKAAFEKRRQLFEILDRVQNWLLTRSGGSSPLKFDACINQFLKRMQSGRELELTQQLFNDQSPNLIESDLHNLADAWGTVVSGFVDDAQDTNKDDKLDIGDPKTIASFFCIHNSLETLYGRLGTNVSLVN